MNGAPSLTGWIPFRIRTRAGPPGVDWCYVGSERFSAPFFTDTIQRCLRTPFNQLFLQDTPLDVLTERAGSHPGLEPTAFVFHGSRCGSTLLAQMAAALPRTIVISEAPPVDHVLGAAVDAERKIQWLRAALSALGQARAGDERHLLVKLDAWHVHQLPLIARAYPNVPFVFLYRDPAAVVSSQLRMAGLHMVPGMLDPSFAGLDLVNAFQLGREEYICRMLGSLYAAAADHASSGRVALINYVEFPQRATSQVIEWCSPDDVTSARARLQQVAQFDAKTPSLFFDASAANRAALDECALDTIARFVSPHYERLEALRRRGTSARTAESD